MTCILQCVSGGKMKFATDRTKQNGLGLLQLRKYTLDGSMKSRSCTVKKSPILKTILVLFCILFLSQNSWAQDTFTATTSGNWSTSGNWGKVGGGPSTYPGESATTDIVIIPSGFAMILDLSPGNSVASVSITSTGSLAMGTNNLIVNTDVTGTGTITVSSGALDVNGNLGSSGTALATLTSSGAANINVAGDWNVTAFTPSTSNVTFDGSGAQSIVSLSDPDFDDLIVNKSGGTLTVNQDVTTASDLTITTGTFDANSYLITVGGSFTQNGTLTDGSKGSPSFEFVGTGTMSGSGNIEFDDVTFSGSGATYTISANFAASSFDLSDGTFNAGSNIITIFGAGGTADFDVSDGDDFNAGTSKFIFTTTAIGTQTINNDLNTVSFYDFEHSPSLGRSLTVTGTGSFDITHSFIRAGQSSTVTGNELNLTGATLIYDGDVAMDISNEWPTATDPSSVEITTGSQVTHDDAVTRITNHLKLNASGANLDIAAGTVQVDSQLTLTNGTVTESGGSFAWGTGSTTLLYNGTAPQSAGVEWETAGAVPDSVRVNNSTSTNPALDLGSSTLPSLPGNLTLADGSVGYDHDGDSLTVGGNVIGGSGSFGITGTNKAKLIVTGGSSQITSSDATTLHDVTFRSTVTGGSLSQITVEGILELEESSEVTLANAITASTITLDGTLNLGGYSIGGTPAFTLGSSGVLNTDGSSLSGYTINSDAGTVVYNGTSSEVMPGITFHNLEIANSSGVDVSTNTPTVDTLTLTTGILTTTSGLITADTVITGGSFSAILHVNGPLAISGSGTKTFPIGKNGIYKPVTVTGTSGATKFELFNSDPSGTPVLPLQVISTLRYYQGSGGSISSGSITLPYDLDDGGISTEGNLRVAHSTTGAGGSYSSVGPSGGGSGIPGTLTSDIDLDLLGHFTLGSITPDNSLPVSLTSFTANAQFSKITLNWQTESEIDNQGFNIYRTVKDEDNWSKINAYMIPGQGNTSQRTDYEYIDNSVAGGYTYEYMLESISYAGVRVQEKVIEVFVPLPKEFALLGNYPNPFNPTTQINFRLPEQSDVSILIYGVRGNLVKELALNQVFEAGDHQLTWDATDNSGQPVASGMYVYLFTAGNYKKTAKMLLLK